MSGFRYPNITGFSQQEQLRQLKSYLYQLVEQLNNTEVPAVAAAQKTEKPAVTQKDSGSAAQDFSALKSLIIKSADIVEAYSAQIEKRLEGHYVSASAFGAYAENTSSRITANSTEINQKYESLQSVVTDLETKFLETEAYIRTGVLFYARENDPLPAGAPVYGMEVGQQAEDGTFRRFSRFTSYSMCFYDAQGAEFATITEGRLKIRHAAVEQSFTLGGFTDEVLPDGSLVTRWVGM